MKRTFFILCLALAFSAQIIAQSFTDSNLPIIIITTDHPNNGIPDEPKALATMKIIYNGSDNRNYLTDQNTAASLNYNGRIGIEVRGSSSQSLPKKQYSLTTLLNDNISNNNVSLLDMPKENDWVLNGLAYDASSIRDYISYNLSRQIGEYAPRTQYCEVVIDGDYKGLYILQEKIKVNSNRVDITKILTTDTNLPELSGGYIIKSDKVAGQDVPAWNMPSYTGTTDFILEFPKPADITGTQSYYIQTVFQNLANASKNTSISAGYPSVIDIPSFVDFMLINELAANVDAYQFSTFFHKERNGKLRAGPLWDLNLTYGNDLTMWGLDRSKTDQWQFNNGDNTGAKFWYDLFNNAKFKCYLAKRWHELTQNGQPLELNKLKTYIDETVSYISEAAERNNNWWGISDSGEINKIKTFLTDRSAWMTTQLGSYSACTNIATPPLVISRINYHPGTTSEFTDSNDQEFIEITNNGNDDVDVTGFYFRGTGFSFVFPSTTISGQSVIQIANDKETFRKLYDFAPFGEFTRNLSNSTQKLMLADAFGNVIDEVEYSTESPWPDADGNGSYIKLTGLDLDNDIGSNWTAATEAPQSNYVTGLEDKLSLKVDIFPNPAENNLTVKCLEVITSLQFTDMQGQVIETIPANTSTVITPMNHFKSGLYLIKIKAGSRSIQKKIMVK